MNPEEYNATLNYFKNLHPEDQPQEIYELIAKVAEDSKDALELAEEIEKVAEHVDEREDL